MPSARTPAVEPRDAVGPVEQQRARGHDDGRAAGASVVQAAGDAGLGVGIHGARRLDEHEHFGVGQQRTGEHDALPLAARERAPPLLDLGVEARGERVDDILGIRDRITRRMASSSPAPCGSRPPARLPEKSIGSAR